MPQLPGDGAPGQPIQSLPTAPMKPSIARVSASVNIDPRSRPESPLSYRRSNPLAASLYTSTLSPPGSRSMSPVGRGSPSRPPSSAPFDAPSNRLLSDAAGDNPGDPLHLILKAFVPHVAIHTSAEVNILCSNKGFKHGLWEILRPFGENIPGKVTIRDSNGVSKAAEDFSVRFTRFGEGVEQPNATSQGIARWDQQVLRDVEAVVERHLSYAEDSFLGIHHQGDPMTQGLDVGTASPYYALYLRRLLSGLPIAPHETFGHPVACIIAASAHSADPLRDLTRVYNETSQGSRKLPPWVDSENCLRYYVLIHDEETGDITKAMTLFEQMKRHFGLHCHLLRVRSGQCLETDDDSMPLPRSDWMSAAEELAEIRRSESEEDFEDQTRYIFESDATGIRTFVKELVMQSIIPHMERRVSEWNDQVASRRKGIAGRFMSLSRKFAFGGSRTSVGGKSTTKDNYDPSGFFRAEADEAILRKLADYAFMLRDWKLAHSTYDLLRTDFSDSKAWKYHAAANEMAAVSLLIIPQHISSKLRSEAIDQMLESAFYSYNTRCGAPYGALRSLTLTLELLRLRSGSHIDDASRWGVRLLESRILGPVGDALIKERLAICYASKLGVGNWRWGSRRRKSATWRLLAADAWVQQEKFIPTQACLNEAWKMYSALPSNNGIAKFTIASAWMESLQHGISQTLRLPEDGDGLRSQDGSEEHIDVQSEALMDTRPRRASSVRRAGVPETAPLHSNSEDTEDTADSKFDQSQVS